MLHTRTLEAPIKLQTADRFTTDLWLTCTGYRSTGEVLRPSFDLDTSLPISYKLTCITAINLRLMHDEYDSNIINLRVCTELQDFAAELMLDWYKYDREWSRVIRVSSACMKMGDLERSVILQAHAVFTTKNQKPICRPCTSPFATENAHEYAGELLWCDPGWQKTCTSTTASSA